MKCPSCGYENKEGELVCSMCSAPLKKAASSEPQPPVDMAMPLAEAQRKDPSRAAFRTPLMDRKDDDRETAHVPDEIKQMRAANQIHQAEAEAIRKRRTKGYTIFGALFFTGLQVVVTLPIAHEKIILIVTICVSLLLGAFLGLIIGKQRAGLFKGAFISIIFFTILHFALLIPFLPKGADLNRVLMYALMKGIFVGLIPGAVIGLHVSVSE